MSSLVVENNLWVSPSVLRQKFGGVTNLFIIFLSDTPAIIEFDGYMPLTTAQEATKEFSTTLVTKQSTLDPKQLPQFGLYKADTNARQTPPGV
jgi:hypothetical protein